LTLNDRVVFHGRTSQRFVELGFEKVATMLIAPLEGPNGKLAGALKTYPSISYVPAVTKIQ
jgi:hypothetical protein